MILVPETGL